MGTGRPLLTQHGKVCLAFPCLIQTQNIRSNPSIGLADIYGRNQVARAGTICAIMKMEYLASLPRAFPLRGSGIPRGCIVSRHIRDRQFGKDGGT
jgi:hypothetical protein